MNPYITGGMALVILILGWQLKASVTRNGELTAKLEAQASETIEAADANATNQTTITGLEARVKKMIEDRRIDSEVRERVLDQREQELIAANARADQLQDERDDEIDTNPDCADLASLSLDMFCPAAAHQLRQRSLGEGRN
jgi:glycyl-tRNA synthetase beta subunit